MSTNNKQAIIVASRTKLDLQQYNNDQYFVIGVEQGCLEIIEQNVKLDLAIGDFDHVNDEETILIEKNAIIFNALSSHKDILDGQAALNFATAQDYLPIKMIVNPTKRIDMNISVMGLMKSYNDLEILSDDGIIKKIPAGTNEVLYEPSKYVSFYSLYDNNLVTIKNMAYECDDFSVNIFDLDFLSNEFLKDQNAMISCKSDLIMIITK